MIILRQESPADIANPPWTVEIKIDSDGLTATDLAAYFRQFMLAMGYAPQTVSDVMGES
jgi:hypothetical protein